MKPDARSELRGRTVPGLISQTHLPIQLIAMLDAARAESRQLVPSGFKSVRYSITAARCRREKAIIRSGIRGYSEECWKRTSSKLGIIHEVSSQKR